MLGVFGMAIVGVAVVHGWAHAQAGSCRKDTDCKGDRICDEGVCRAPSTSHTPSTPAPPPMSVAPAATSTFFGTLGAGTGAAIVSGQTESLDYQVNCCVVRSPLHVRGAGGMFVRPNLALAFALRIGFPLGTESPDAKGSAVSGILRLHWISPLGPQIHLGAGAGLLRYPIKILNDPSFDGQDTVALGPVLAEIGGGYAFGLGGPLHLFIDVSAMAALATGEQAAGTHVESGLNLEAEAGLLFRQ